MKKQPLRINLLAIYLIIGPLLRFFFRIKSKGSLDINSRERHIIASNHPSMPDPFIILAAMPFRDFVRILPIRFITTEKYMRPWYMGTFLSFLGCLSTSKKNGKKPLQDYVKRLKEGETMFIFPRGWLEKKGTVHSAKIGVAYMEREVQNSKIHLVKVYIDGKISFFNILKRRVQTVIQFKGSIRHPVFDSDLQSLANDVMKRIDK